MRQLVEAIEKHRRSRALILAASNLEIDFLPPLYDMLCAIGRVERLDVVLYCRGGIANAARRIALLLHEFTDHLCFIVPDRCESSGTIAVLGGHEIIAGPAAVFSPVDPLLQMSFASSDEGPSVISAQDVRLFGEMSQHWFGLEEADARRNALSVLCETVFPTSLTSFYRSIREIEAICLELLSLHMGEEATEAKSRTVDHLLFGCHSHSFALNRGEMAALGLPVRGDLATEDLAWEIARELRASVGGAARRAREDDWLDTIMASRGATLCRRRTPGSLTPIWEPGEAI